MKLDTANYKVYSRLHYILKKKEISVFRSIDKH